MSSDQETISVTPSDVSMNIGLINTVANKNTPQALSLASSDKPSNEDPEERCFIRSTN